MANLRKVVLDFLSKKCNFEDLRRAAANPEPEIYLGKMTRYELINEIVPANTVSGWELSGHIVIVETGYRQLPNGNWEHSMHKLRRTAKIFYSNTNQVEQEVRLLLEWFIESGGCFLHVDKQLLNSYSGEAKNVSLEKILSSFRGQVVVLGNFSQEVSDLQQQIASLLRLEVLNPEYK